jgi:hypothetical protein
LATEPEGIKLNSDNFVIIFYESLKQKHENYDKSGFGGMFKNRNATIHELGKNHLAYKKRTVPLNVPHKSTLQTNGFG